MDHEQSCLTIQYNSQIVTCETYENSTDPLLKGTGNLASGMIDIIQKKAEKCANPPNHRIAACCVTGPQISPYAGGNSCQAFTLHQNQQYIFCNARRTASVIQLQSMVPACERSPHRVSAAERFAQYRRFAPSAPCPGPPSDMIIPSNPAIPKAVDGPCVIVPGILYNKIN